MDRVDACQPHPHEVAQGHVDRLRHTGNITRHNPDVNQQGWTGFAFELSPKHLQKRKPNQRAAQRRAKPRTQAQALWCLPGSLAMQSLIYAVTVSCTMLVCYAREVEK